MSRLFATGSRRDSLRDKPQVERLCFSALEKISEVHWYGDSRYGRGNWRKGQPASCVASSLLRHLFAWLRGVNDDTGEGGSNMNHLLHVSWNAIFLVFMFVVYPKKFDHLDDRQDDFGEYVSEAYKETVEKTGATYEDFESQGKTG